MGPDGVFPAEMPEPGRPLVAALDDNTVERLVAGRLGPDDAPPGYAGVARVLQAAGGSAGPGELAGRDAALAMFRAHGPASRAQGRSRPAVRRRGPGRVRGRLVALALAGVVAAGGLWLADGARNVPGLGSPTGGVGSGGPGSTGPGSATPGQVAPARPTTPPVTGAGGDGRATAGTPERSGTRPGVSPGGGSAHGARPARPARPPRPTPEPEPTPKPEPKPKPTPEKSRPDPTPRNTPKPKHQR